MPLRHAAAFSDAAAADFLIADIMPSSAYACYAEAAEVDDRRVYAC